MTNFWNAFMEKMAKPVYIYRNINKSKDEHVYSVRDRKTNRVIDHTQDLILSNAQFRVSEKGRARVIKEKRKNVHAGIAADTDAKLPKNVKWMPIKYNPYHTQKFLDPKGNPVDKAKFVKLTPKGVFVSK